MRGIGLGKDCEAIAERGLQEMAKRRGDEDGNGGAASGRRIAQTGWPRMRTPGRASGGCLIPPTVLVLTRVSARNAITSEWSWRLGST
jgi:hypothetical protein